MKKLVQRTRAMVTVTRIEILFLNFKCELYKYKYKEIHLNLKCGRES